MRHLVLLLLLAMAACSGPSEMHFATPSADDPTWNLNGNRFPNTTNDLLVPASLDANHAS